MWGLGGQPTVGSGTGMKHEACSAQSPRGDAGHLLGLGLRTGAVTCRAEILIID